MSFVGYLVCTRGLSYLAVVSYAVFQRCYIFAEVAGARSLPLRLWPSVRAELLLEQRLVAEGKDHELTVSDPTPLGDPLLDECLDMVQVSTKKRGAQHWITKIASIKDLKDRIARRLCQRGVLREDEGKVLLFFTRKIYPELDPAPEQALVAELEQAILTETTPRKRLQILSKLVMHELDVQELGLVAPRSTGALAPAGGQIIHEPTFDIRRFMENKPVKYQLKS